MRQPRATALLLAGATILLAVAREPENDAYKLFDKYDADGSGAIDHEELQELLLAREIAQDLDTASLEHMYSILGQRFESS